VPLETVKLDFLVVIVICDQGIILRFFCFCFFKDWTFHLEQYQGEKFEFRLYLAESLKLI